jgi:anionic cell wall polymer biosynthesis LytR-Cps2A-Psr (LCP) family protein
LRSNLLPHTALEEGKPDNMIVHVFEFRKSIGGRGHEDMILVVFVDPPQRSYQAPTIPPDSDVEIFEIPCGYNYLHVL